VNYCIPETGEKSFPPSEAVPQAHELGWEYAMLLGSRKKALWAITRNYSFEGKYSFTVDCSLKCGTVQRLSSLREVLLLARRVVCTISELEKVVMY
jgi:hypothetical protein